MTQQRPTAAGRTVVITGGTSGIGRAVVDEFVRMGDTVVVLDCDAPPDDLAELATVVVGDVCSTADNRRVVETALELTGAVDVFIGNAGIHDGGATIRDLDGDDLAGIARRVFDVDVVGYLLGAKAALEPLVASRGCMIFTLSDASFVVRGVGAGIGYAIAKHGALGLVKHLAADLAPDVRVNAVAPGGILTGLRAAIPGDGTRASFEDPAAVREAVLQLNPLGTMLTPQQIAPLYTLLASEASVGMTGEVLRPDGGLAIR